MRWGANPLIFLWVSYVRCLRELVNWMNHLTTALFVPQSLELINSQCTVALSKFIYSLENMEKLNRCMSIKQANKH